MYVHSRMVTALARADTHDRKFGKHIQKRQLEIPEYAASFVDYKALKKLIKKLSATPLLEANLKAGEHGAQDPQTSLQANKATFFFRLERELEKVNTFYLQKEAEVCGAHKKSRLLSLADSSIVETTTTNTPR